MVAPKVPRQQRCVASPLCISTKLCSQLFRDGMRARIRHVSRLVFMETFCVEPFQAGGGKEFGEAQRRGIGDYFMDPWNVCDLLGLVLGAWGLIARIADVDSPWGRSFYALSAPLLFFRIPFFAQILPSQGPMIEVCMPTKCIL